MNKETVPVFVVTGFLDSGKTTLIRRLLENRRSQETHILTVQFESGEEALDTIHNNCVMNFGKKLLDTEPGRVADAISAHLSETVVDEIWIEWNGMTPFSELQALFLAPPLGGRCRIEKVIHTADAEKLESLLGRTGAALPGQIANCDFAVLRGAKSVSEFRRLKRLLKSMNSGVGVYEFSRLSDIFGAIYKEKRHPVNTFCIWLATILLPVFAVSRIFDLSSTPVNTFINVFLGIIFQALPFLLVGVLISSAIQIFVSADAIERKFPKNPELGMLIAILLGFCLPVCDCASVPIFRSLVKKGVPVPAAVTFLLAAPVINPVVMLSTYYAFNSSLRVVAVRIGLGIITALLAGLFFSGWPSKGDILSGDFDGMMCSCGCWSGTNATDSIKEKFKRYVRHSEAEFFNVGKFLMIGAFISGLFQTIGTKTLLPQGTPAYALSVLIMMVLALLLSLCSSSDAVIARSFSTCFSSSAAMGFLVFGPMIDIKNLIMLSGGFTRKFVLKLFIAVFAICFLVVFAFARPLLGV